MAYQLYNPISVRTVQSPFVFIANKQRLTFSKTAVMKYIGDKLSHVILRYDTDTNRLAFEFTNNTEGAIKITKSHRYCAMYITGVIESAGWHEDACKGRRYIQEPDETSEYPYINIYE